MKRLLFALILLVVSTSCSQVILPRAINTVNAVSLDELNLVRSDYKILNTVTADALVYYSTSADGKIVTIQCPEDNFALKYVKTNSPFSKYISQKNNKTPTSVLRSGLSYI